MYDNPDEQLEFTMSHVSSGRAGEPDADRLTGDFSMQENPDGQFEYTLNQAPFGEDEEEFDAVAFQLPEVGVKALEYISEMEKQQAEEKKKNLKRLRMEKRRAAQPAASAETGETAEDEDLEDLEDIGDVPDTGEIGEPGEIDDISGQPEDFEDLEDLEDIDDVGDDNFDVPARPNANVASVNDMLDILNKQAMKVHEQAPMRPFQMTVSPQAKKPPVAPAGKTPETVSGKTPAQPEITDGKEISKAEKLKIEEIPDTGTGETPKTKEIPASAPSKEEKPAAPEPAGQKAKIVGGKDALSETKEVSAGPKPFSFQPEKVADKKEQEKPGIEPAPKKEGPGKVVFAPIPDKKLQSDERMTPGSAARKTAEALLAQFSKMPAEKDGKFAAEQSPGSAARKAAESLVEHFKKIPKEQKEEEKPLSIDNLPEIPEDPFKMSPGMGTQSAKLIPNAPTTPSMLGAAPVPDVAPGVVPVDPAEEIVKEAEKEKKQEKTEKKPQYPEQFRDSLEFLEESIVQYGKYVENIGRNGLAAANLGYYRDDIQDILDLLKYEEIDLRPFWERIVKIDLMLRTKASIYVKEVGYNNFKQYQIINDPPLTSWWWYLNRTVAPPIVQPKFWEFWKKL